MHEFTSALVRDGYFVAGNLISAEKCAELIDALPMVEGAGARDLLARSSFRDLVSELREACLLNTTLDGLVAVQCTFFEKTRLRNWSVRPHRDSILSVEGAGSWQDTGFKDGMKTARPPGSFLEKCLAVRVQLDGAPTEDISVVPESHLDSESRKRSEAIPIPVPQGGALVFRPSLVHASSKLQDSDVRRVIHYLFAPAELPAGYRWYHAI